jgi:hypothetical protein
MRFERRVGALGCVIKLIQKRSLQCCKQVLCIEPAIHNVTGRKEKLEVYMDGQTGTRSASRLCARCECFVAVRGWVKRQIGWLQGVGSSGTRQALANRRACSKALQIASDRRGPRVGRYHGFAQAKRGTWRATRTAVSQPTINKRVGMGEVRSVR